MALPVSQTIRNQSAGLAELIVAKQYARQPEIWKSYGHPGREKSVRDAGYHLTYLCEALDADDPVLFNEYLAWVKVLFINLKFPGHVLQSSLDCTHEALVELLPPDECASALQMLEEGMRSLATAPANLPSFIEGSRPFDLLARKFLDKLLRGDRRSASRMILEAVDGGASIQEVYSQVFQRSQRELGRLWQTNQISVAQEHFCTAATQMVISQLYPYLFSSERSNRTGLKLVMACVGGELHEIGARMVADIFEMEGWDTYFLGANTPPESILRSVVERKADVLALSVTMTYHIRQVEEIITILRSANSSVRILVGGYPFNLSHGLWRKVGADGYATDADTAIVEARRVLQ
jgi:methylmalonyl-CoA mutase cobalamin-binding domain/chain